MSFINPITDFSIALKDLDQNVAQTIRNQVSTQTNFEDYWYKTIMHIQNEIERGTNLDITPFQKNFLLTLLTNCADNATQNGNEYKEI